VFAWKSIPGRGEFGSEEGVAMSGSANGFVSLPKAILCHCGKVRSSKMSFAA
jgi:hypothetical protein